MNYPIMVVTALGRETFSLSQARSLDAIGGVSYIRAPNPIPINNFHRRFCQARMLALTPRSTPMLTRHFLAPLKQLRGVAVFATGVDWIDTDYLATRGIQLSRLKDYATDTVAEHAIGMLLTMSRRFHLSWDRVRGAIPAGISLRGWELKGKRVGILGYGRTGRAIAARLKGFSCHLMVHDRFENKGKLRAWIKPLDVLILSLSRQFGDPPVIGEKELHASKRGLVLINPARAALVDSRAMRTALSSGHLGGYAVDPVDQDVLGRGLRPGLVFQSGHTGWYSAEALDRGLEAWVQNIAQMAKNVCSGYSSHG